MEALGAVTVLLQRIRGAHPTAGLYEAADLQWWWRTPRSTDDLPQLFWFDDVGRPVAAVIATDWGDRSRSTRWSCPTRRPTGSPTSSNAGSPTPTRSGLGAVGLEVDRADDVLREVLVGHGFAVDEGGVVETWLAAERPTRDQPTARRLPVVPPRSTRRTVRIT